MLLFSLHHKIHQLQLHCNPFLRVTRERDGSVSGLTFILKLCHPTNISETNATSGNEIAPYLQL